MKSFYQYITEVFFKGFKADFDYCELFKNPTADEFNSCAHSVGGRYVSSLYTDTAGENGIRTLAGFLVGKDLYIFDREKSQHRAVSYQLPKSSNTVIPLFIYEFPGNILAVELAAFSLNVELRASESELAKLQQQIYKHPKFKGFKLLDVNSGKLRK